MEKKISLFIQLLQIKRYSANSVETYTNAFKQFLMYFKTFDVDDLTTSQIEEYLNFLVYERKISTSYQKQMVAAIKFWYINILGRKIELNYLYPDRTSFKIPEIFSQAEIKLILNTCENIKHKAILATVYSCGLRVSELTNLKIKDIDSDAMIVSIRQSKGNQDRVVVLAEKLLVLLRDYFKAYKPSEYLFEGRDKGKYSDRSVQQILKQVLAKTKIKKQGTVHTLRHSYATHLVEQGTDIRFCTRTFRS